MQRIQCPNCQATYDLPDESIGPAGRKVRCAACKTSWIATREADAPVALPDEPMTDHPALPERTSPRPWHERMAQTRQPVPAGRAALALLAVAVCLGGLIVLRRPIVAAMPETAAAYAALGLPVNLRGLDLRGVHSSLVRESDTDMLVVQGEITNVSRDKKALPRLHFTVRDARGLTLYSWTAQADAKDIGPGETLSFRRRLASPPAEGRDVLVRFASRADLVADLR